MSKNESIQSEIEITERLACDQDGCGFEGLAVGTVESYTSEVVFRVTCPKCGTEHENIVANEDMQDFDGDF